MSDEQMNNSTFGRLFIIMIIAMTVLTVLIMVLASGAANDVNSRLDERRDIENSDALAKRIAPVGKFVATASAPILATEPIVLSGKEAYTSCVACHGAGSGGAPATNDADAWSERISKGLDTLYNHAINGFQGEAGVMPAKGGDSTLSDESVKAAVDYILEQTQ